MRQGRRHPRNGRATPCPIFAFAAAALFAMPAAVRAEEPLSLRIRPNPSPEGATGLAGGRPAGSGTGRETVWERADRRARLAIASVCTGCLDARVLERPSVSVSASPLSPATAVAASDPAPSTTGDP